MMTMNKIKQNDLLVKNVFIWILLVSVPPGSRHKRTQLYIWDSSNHVIDAVLCIVFLVPKIAFTHITQVLVLKLSLFIICVRIFCEKKVDLDIRFLKKHSATTISFKRVFCYRFGLVEVLVLHILCGIVWNRQAQKRELPL